MGVLGEKERERWGRGGGGQSSFSPLSYPCIHRREKKAGKEKKRKIKDAVTLPIEPLQSARDQKD